MLRSVPGLIVDLVREFSHDRVGILHACQFLSEYGCTLLHCGEVELHIDVGGTCTSLHVEYLHVVIGVVVKDITGPSVDDSFHENTVDICLGFCCRMIISSQIIIIKEISERRRLTVDSHVTCAEVHAAGHGTMDSAQVDHQLTVHIEPEVIVSRKLKDNVVSPSIHTAGCLCKAGLQFCSEIIVRCLPVMIDGIQLFVLSRIAVRKQLFVGCLIKRIQVLGIEGGKSACLQCIKGEELPVLERIRAAVIVGSQLVVNREIPSVIPVQSGEILCTVKFKIARLIVYTLNKEVVDLVFSGIEFSERMVRFCDRISVIFQFRS